MNRLSAVFRLRYLRWVACAAVIPALWACNSRKLVQPNGEPSQVVKNRFQQSINRDLDLVFLIDDSSSMAPLQTKMQMRLPDFMNVLKGLPAGLPNVHIGIVSSSLGAGAYANVPGCQIGSAGDQGGRFIHLPQCTGLHAGERFISSIVDANNQRVNNFDGDITDVFQCMALLGQGGCGFEHQFAALQLALTKAYTNDAENGGFLRDDAYLAVIMLTNEDDCSVPGNSGLFDPRVQTLADAAPADNPTMAGVRLGGLQSYRCNEFGHLCGAAPGTRPPHDPPATMTTLNNCVSAEDGILVKAADFASFLTQIKPREQLLVAAIAGVPDRYTVLPHSFLLGNGTMENQPQMDHSCTQADGTYADPGVRIKAWLDMFPGSILESICANDFRAAMMNIATVIGRALGAQCVPTNIEDKADGTPNCDVTKRTRTGSTNMDVPVPFCNANNALAGATMANPCWRFGQNNQCAGGTQVLELCFDPACDPASKPMNSTDALVSCVLTP